jgi:hypothetical protein
LFVIALRLSDVYVKIFDVEIRVDITCDKRLCLNDLLQLDFDEVVEGINMLLDETLDFEEGRK